MLWVDDNVACFAESHAHVVLIQLEVDGKPRVAIEAILLEVKQLKGNRKVR
jgi:hypothetical protein